jgi:hypothetical protein
MQVARLPPSLSDIILAQAFSLSQEIDLSSVCRLFRDIIRSHTYVASLNEVRGWGDVERNNVWRLRIPRIQQEHPPRSVLKLREPIDVENQSVVECHLPNLVVFQSPYIYVPRSLRLPALKHLTVYVCQVIFANSIQSNIINFQEIFSAISDVSANLEYLVICVQRGHRSTLASFTVTRAEMILDPIFYESFLDSARNLRWLSLRRLAA